MNPLKSLTGGMFKSSNKDISQSKTSIYDIQIESLQGQEIDLSSYKGKYLLFVNVASKCGFTPQYKDLQTLQDTYADNLVVIGVPCNQFGRQEPGNAFEIQEFCQANYGVSFPITRKTNVKGEQKHDLYQWLTRKALNGTKDSSVKWNFQKYLVSPEGELINYFYSTTKPLSSKITKYL